MAKFLDVLYTIFTGLTADASPSAANDYLMTVDASASALKKVLISSIASGGGGLTNKAHIKRTSGDITCNSTSWANLDTGTDLTIAAQAGDIVEVAISAFWNSEGVNGCLDVATIVSASPVNYLGASGGGSDLGVQAWIGAASQMAAVGGPICYTVQAGDISSGNVTLRLRYRTTAASNKTLRSSSTQPFHFSAKNLSR